MGNPDFHGCMGTCFGFLFYYKSRNLNRKIERRYHLPLCGGGLGREVFFHGDLIGVVVRAYVLKVPMGPTGSSW